MTTIEPKLSKNGKILGRPRKYFTVEERAAAYRKMNNESHKNRHRDAKEEKQAQETRDRELLYAQIDNLRRRGRLLPHGKDWILIDSEGKKIKITSQDLERIVSEAVES